MLVRLCTCGSVSGRIVVGGVCGVGERGRVALGGYLVSDGIWSLSGGSTRKLVVLQRVVVVVVGVS